ncbi:MAG: restriction endonuclease subunit S [Clostridia bacterium]|nr:restriction endonuclease subunit S [Clostridia bacterium]
MRLKDGVTKANTGLDAIKRAPIVDVDTGLKCIRIQDISQNKGYEDWGFTTTTDKDRANFQLKENDVLVARTGATVGVSVYINKTLQSVYNNGTIRLRFNDTVIPKFAYYTFQTKEFMQYIDNISCVATQPNLRIEGLLRFTIPDFDTKKQRKIVDFLSNYDNLIENNNKRIRLLEQMAENLYKEWFVRFRFPRHKTAEFENGLPKGWEYKKLDKIITVCYGKDHSKVEDGSIPVYGSGGIMRYGNRALYDGESVLIPRKGSLNNIMWVNEPFWSVDTMFYTKALIPHIEKYLFYVLSSLDMASFNTGAALPSMTTDILYHLKVLIPNETVLSKFDLMVTDLYEQRNMLEKENQNLIKQRDLLLPRLMSGKLEV